MVDFEMNVGWIEPHELAIGPVNYENVGVVIGTETPVLEAPVYWDDRDDALREYMDKEWMRGCIHKRITVILSLNTPFHVMGDVLPVCDVSTVPFS